MVETKNRGIGTSITIISPLIWVKQSYTTHLGMVYTIYKHADEGGFWHCFTQITKDYLLLRCGLMMFDVV
jgi:hypothetical protein